jgi:RNA-directed DNA polymerase
MKRHGGLFEYLISLENLWRAWRAFQRGKRKRPSVCAFERGVDRRLAELRRALAERRYRPRGYRLMLIHEPKRRLIAAAGVRDRVVHHAVHQVLSPRLDPGLIDTTYACLAGRGSHRAVLAFQQGLRRYPFVLTLDIRHYFLSIDQGILLDLMARRLKERPLLELLGRIIAGGDGLYRHSDVPELLGLEPGFPAPGVGLPIGNLTSQWWGNHYLSGLDHYIKRELKVPHYLRYMDDLALFGASRNALLRQRDTVAEWLWAERRLRIKRPQAQPRATGGCFGYLGQRVSRAGIAPSREALARLGSTATARVRAGSMETLERSLASSRGVVLGPLCQSVLTKRAGLS